MLKTKKSNKRFLSAVLGFSFGFVSVSYMLSSSSIPVSAEDVPSEVSAFIETVEDWADNAEAIVNLDANFDYYMPIGFVRAYIVNLQEAYSANTEFSISGSQYVAYYRLTSGGTVYASNIYLSNQDSSTICRSPHFDITYTLSSVSGHTVSYSSDNYIYTVSADTSNIGSYCSLSVRDALGFFTSTYTTSGNTVSVSCYTNSDSIPVLSSRRISASNLVGGFPSELVFPSGTLSKASPWDYYNNTLIPYLQTTYPNIPDDLIPDPYSIPYDPIYPTDFVTGIPKEWTVENPQLPTAADLDFEHYEEDLTGFHPIQEIKETVDIIKAMDFWWWLTEKTLDSLNLKIFYVIFLTVGVLIFIVWIIGQ